MDSCLFNIFYSQDQDSFSQLYNLILSENVNGTILRVSVRSYSRGCWSFYPFILLLKAVFLFHDETNKICCVNLLVFEVLVGVLYTLTNYLQTSDPVKMNIVKKVQCMDAALEYEALKC